MPHLACKPEFRSIKSADQDNTGAFACGTEPADEKLSGSLNITLTNFEGLMRQLRVGEPNTNAPPFNILDYAKAADEFDNVAKDLNAVVGSINQSTPGIQRLSQQASADA